MTIKKPLTFKRSNYRNKKVFLAGFFLTSLICLLGLVIFVSSEAKIIFLAAYLIGIIGLIDDIFGSREKGIKGHLKAFLAGKITTGFVKLIGIGLISFYCGYFFAEKVFDIFLNTVLIAGMSNLFNLLDLRPGRAIKFAAVLFLVSLYFLTGNHFYYVLFLLLIYFAYLPLDLKEITMLGDAGSNVLGFFVGTTFLFLVKITFVKILFVLAVVLLNLASEKISFTEFIENNRFLNFFDRLGRN
jgi:UDP-N-acetylmuramyl pentapeptide phosphotransferase/UDP-N-acetylglucosamine-1-phosphate transferase